MAMSYMNHYADVRSVSEDASKPTRNLSVKLFVQMQHIQIIKLSLMFLMLENQFHYLF